MKTIAIVAGLALFAVPASAEVVHQTSVVHNGRAVAISYEPDVKTQYRQSGIGPRATPICLWSSRIAVQRIATGADGQPIAALSRKVETRRGASGSQVGHCSILTSRGQIRSAASPDTLRAAIAEVATNDAATLRAELASLATLGTGETHAR